MNNLRKHLHILLVFFAFVPMGCQKENVVPEQERHSIVILFENDVHCAIDTVLTNSQGKPVLLANTGTQFANIGQLYIGADGHMDITLIPMEQINQLNPTVNAVVEQVKEQVDMQTNHVVAYSEVPILITDGNGNRMVRKAETNAGDLTADALRWQMGTDIGLLNGGAIRIDLPAGDIPYKDIISLLPFDNMVWKTEVTGAQILETLRSGISKLPDENGDFPQVAGLRFTVTMADHSVSNVEVLQSDGNYAPLDLSATYTLSTIGYCITGGGYDGVLADCTLLEQSTNLYRDALDATPQGRIIIQD